MRVCGCVIYTPFQFNRMKFAMLSSRTDPWMHTLHKPHNIVLNERRQDNQRNCHRLCNAILRCKWMHRWFLPYTRLLICCQTPWCIVNCSFRNRFNFEIETKKKKNENNEKKTTYIKKSTDCKLQNRFNKIEAKRKFLQKCPISYASFASPTSISFLTFLRFLLSMTKANTHSENESQRERVNVQPKQRATTTQQIEQLSRAFYGFVPYLFCDVLLPLLLLLLLLVLPLVFVAVSETGTELNRRRWFSLNCFSCSATPLADRTSSGRGSTGWTRLRLSENVLDHRQKVHFHNKQLWTIHGIHQNPRRKLPIEGAVAPEMFFNLNVISCIKHTVSKSTHFMPTSARFLRHLFFSFAYAVQAKSRTKLGQFHFTICILINIHRVSVRSRLLLRILSVLLHQRMVKWYSLFCFLRNCHPGFCQ